MRVVASLFLLALLGCNDTESIDQRCVKGRYITTYCGGLVIQVLDGTPIGTDWKGNSSELLQNCVVASLDTLAFKKLTVPGLPRRDSIFYFQYRQGGYPQKEYILCYPAPFVTLTAASGTGCQ